jgi:hypothetical protein
MKVVFAGPSIFGLDLTRFDFEIRGPARQGDVLRATREGASVIGLVDGWFGGSASVWHKELLHALEAGAKVLGAASMGALRAAECADFGMIPVGRIAEAYRNGELDDDAAVAVTSGPEELSYEPFVEPLVDVWPTVAALLRAGEISSEEASALTDAAAAIFFEDRTVEEIALRAFGPGQRARTVAASYERGRVSQKRIDAKLLLETVAAAEPRRRAPPAWRMERSAFWRSQVSA